jgi:hypothetical protein
LRKVNEALLSTLDENATVPTVTDSGMRRNIVEILKLRRDGALDDNYNVVNFEELKFSPAIRNFESRLGVFDLTDKIEAPKRESTKTQGVDVKNLSQLQNNP